MKVALAVVVVDMEGLYPLSEGSQVFVLILAHQVEVSGVDADAEALLTGKGVEVIDESDGVVFVRAVAFADRALMAVEKILKTDDDAGLLCGVDQRGIDMLVYGVDVLLGVFDVAAGERDAVNDEPSAAYPAADLESDLEGLDGIVDEGRGGVGTVCRKRRVRLIDVKSCLRYQSITASGPFS